MLALTAAARASGIDLIILLRDITQAYVQSRSKLNRRILVRPPPEIVRLLKLTEDQLIEIFLPLYGVPESGNHWWVAYSTHIKTKLGMESSTYDPCLMITKEGPFGMVCIQVDDTLYAGIRAFIQSEDDELKAAKLKAKDPTELTEGIEIPYNGTRIVQEGDKIGMLSKMQGEKLSEVPLDPKDPNYHAEFVCQRARGAWMASSYLPEASYDMAVAAQHQKNPSPDHGKIMNKRIRWIKTPEVVMMMMMMMMIICVLWNLPKGIRTC